MTNSSQSKYVAGTERTPEYEASLLKTLQRKGTASHGDTHVKIVFRDADDSDGGYGVETTVSGDRRYPTEPAMPLDAAQLFAVAQLFAPRPTNYIPVTIAAAPVVVTKQEPVDRRKVGVAALCADYKARRLERSRAWSQFVIDRSLNPRMDAGEFYSVFDSVSAQPLSESRGL